MKLPRVRETHKKHIDRLTKLFNKKCYIVSLDDREMYEVLCLENKPKDVLVSEGFNKENRIVLLRVLVENLENAVNILDDSLNQCPINDFTNYKIEYDGVNYTVYRLDKNGSFDTVREIYCKRI